MEIISPKSGFSLEEILHAYVPLEQWKRAQRISLQKKKSIIDVLIEQSQSTHLPEGFQKISEENLAKGVALYFGLKYKPLLDSFQKITGIEDTPKLKEIIPKLAAKVSYYYRGMYMPIGFQSVPFSMLRGSNQDSTVGEITNLWINSPEKKSSLYLVVAFYDADHLLEMRNYLEAIVIEIGYAGISTVFSTREGIQAAYKQYFPDDLMVYADSDAMNKKKLEEMAHNEEIVQLVDNIILQAIEYKASDIHIKCFEEEVGLKYRVDGILIPQSPIPLSKKNSLIARIKILANLNILERRLPQDGRISSRKYEEKGLQTLRVSTLPTAQGESIVMRLLSGQKNIPSLEKIGLDSQLLNLLKEILKDPQGIFLVTGATGSGKSTTLASVLQYLNDYTNREKHIMTVEDPIEYKIEGATQVAVNEKVGLTFARVLRSVLRQDPNIVLIGEIRDAETVEIAMRAALTGHQVFSTLHTKDATSAIIRILDMGIPEYMIAATISGVLSQRLIRKLCITCRKETSFRESDYQSLGITKEALFKLLKEEKLENQYIYEKVGCIKCGHTGYAGRYPIFEIFRPDERTRAELLSKEHSLDNRRIRKIARELLNMRTLREDGIIKIFKHITSVQEIIKVSTEE
ncbi:MAG: type II/IV secretion system protein [Candidatus Brocadiae bacterium]|nr:type II/IV secretion system protein [Candidatus Brocadiia bacterium]